MGGMIFGHHKGDVQENVISNVLRGGSCLQVSSFLFLLFLICSLLFLFSSFFFVICVGCFQLSYEVYEVYEIYEIYEMPVHNSNSLFKMPASIAYH